MLNLIIGIVLGAMFSPLWIKIGAAISSLIKVLWDKMVKKVKKE